MAFYDRLYHVYLILGDPAAPLLWQWNTWPAAARAIDPLVQAARIPSAGVRPYTIPPVASDPEAVEVTWSEVDHQRWVLPGPGTHDPLARQFISMELWAPDWQICKSETCLPDLYIAFRNEAYWDPNGPFNPFLVLAVAAEQPASVLQQAKQSAHELAGLVNTLLRVHQLRPWGYAWADGLGFTDGIADLMTFGALQPGMTIPSLDSLQGHWDEF